MQLRRLATAVCLASALGSVGACSRRPVSVVLPTVPSTLQLRDLVTSTTGADLSQTQLPELATIVPPPVSTIGFEHGNVTLTGLVTGPGGPVPNATVRIERFVDNLVAGAQTQTDASGQYKFEKIKAGRLRMRAFRTPDFAATDPLIVFVGGTMQQALAVKQYGQVSIQWSLAPGSPRIGQASNLAIQVSQVAVGGDGSVRQTPVVGVGVAVTGLGSLQPDSAAAVATNDRGRAQIPMHCALVGNGQVVVALATGESTAINPPGCQDIVTTTIPPPTTAPTTTILVAPTVTKQPEPTVAPAAVPVINSLAPQPVPPTAAPEVVPVPVVTTAAPLTAPPVIAPPPVPATLAPAVLPASVVTTSIP